MSLTIGDLVGYIRADGSDFERNLARGQLQMQGFRLDVNGQLRDLRGRFVRDTAVMGRAVTDSFSEAEQAGTRITTVYSSVADAQARTFQARMEWMQAAGRRMATALDGSFTRVREAWGRINFDRLQPAASGFLSVAASVGKLGAMLGAAGPAAAGLAATIGSLAPAAAVAMSGMIAMRLASVALKLGMAGVSDAMSAALDPEKAAEFEEALAKLAPSARAFALQVKAMAPELKALQQGVQERLFRGLDGVLKEMGTSTLPILRNGLTNAAGALNLMAHRVGNTAIGLSKSGALGQAISGANVGLYNLARIPGQVVQGLVQIGAAAAPSFGRLTKAAGGAFDKLSERMQKAFESGAMQKAIDNAIELASDLFEVLGNLGSVFASVFKAAQVSGGGMIGVLQEVTGALADAFASKPVQDGLKAIFQTMSTLAKTIGPLLGQALAQIAPIFTALGPPIQTVIKALGKALQPVIKALGPVLAAAARAFGALIEAAAPILPVIGDLVASLLPALTPLFDALAVVFAALAPVVKEVATAIGATLKPVLAGLATVIAPLAKMIGDQLALWLGVVGKLVVALAPSLVVLGEALGELLVALGPLIEAWATLSTELLTALMPLLQPLIDLIGKLAKYLASDLARTITAVVVPAVKAITALLRGDFAGANAYARQAVQGFVDNAVRRFTELPRRAAVALTGLAVELRLKALRAGVELNQAIVEKRAEAIQKIRELPGKAAAALTGLGSKLYGSGQSLVQGFINGILSMLGSVASAASSIVGTARNFFPFSPAKEGPFSGKGWTLYSGQSLATGFAEGITARSGLVQSSIAAMVKGAQGALGGLDTGLLGGALPGTSLPGMTPGANYPAPGASQQPIVIELRGPGLKDVITDIVQTKGRGDVQIAFGQS